MTTERAAVCVRAAELVAGLDTGELIEEWTARLAESGVLGPISPRPQTVERIVTGLQRGLALHLGGPGSRLDVDTGALADDAAMAHVYQRGITITQITEGVFVFLDVVFVRLEAGDLYVPEVAEVVRDFAKRFLRLTGESWSAILVAQRTDAERARAEMQRILESTNEGILLIGRDLTLRYANGRAAELLSPGLPSRVGQSLLRLLAEEVAPRLVDGESFVARSRQLYAATDRVATDDLELLDPPRTLVRYSGPVHDAGGGVIGRVEIYRDATLERQARRARDEFIGLVGHELRTPLAAISGYIDLTLRALVREPAPTDPRLEEYLRRGRMNVERLVRLVETLLTVERFQTGRWPVERRVVDLVPIVHDSVTDHATALGRTVRLDLPERPVLVSGDRDRLAQIATNLVSNALRHASPGFPPEVQLRIEDRAALLTVGDDGSGVPPGERERIFERFYRRPEGNFRSGIGLGLFIVRQLAEAHDGSVSVGEREGGGACFTVRIPLAEAANA